MRIRQTFIWLLISFYAMGQKQEVSFEVSPQKLKVGEVLKWKVVIKGSQEFIVSDLPQIPGFKREGRLVSHSMAQVAGKRQLQHTVTQNYKALEAGSFESPEGVIMVNGQEKTLPIIKITVEDGDQSEADLFAKEKDTDALLFLFVDKQEVYVGEALRIHLAFYVSKDNTQAWQFPENLNVQVAGIAAAIKPKNCLESRKTIVNITPEPARIGGKEYIRYKFFDALFYPLTGENIQIPSQILNMEKLVNGGDSSRVVSETFVSRPFTVQVKPLPDHPLKNRVSVGNYQMSEPAKFPTLRTGKMINYPVIIEGAGNTNSLNFEVPMNDAHFDFYPPTVSGSQKSGAENGNRIFTFKVFPKDSGTFDMGNYFQWIYFNPAIDNYDTLRARGILHLTGEHVESSASSYGNIYADIEKKLITEQAINYRKIIKNAANVLLILMLAAMLFIFDFKRQKPQ